MGNILQKILKLNLQNSQNFIEYIQCGHQIHLQKAVHYICYSLTQKSLGILFTTVISYQFLHNSILYHLICDFHKCIPRQVGRSPLCLKGLWCSHSLYSGPGTPLSFETTEIQHMSLHHFKSCLFQGPFPVTSLSLPSFLSESFLFWDVTAHIFSSIHFAT